MKDDIVSVRWLIRTPAPEGEYLDSLEGMTTTHELDKAYVFRSEDIIRFSMAKFDEYSLVECRLVEVNST
tara:strand:+ start:2721 stop:2930 length:210 start_codon:yes stop_codon:yes gene_type:complete